ncbi:hypothetical protein Tco_0710240 [Tanacetum coccineum]
MTPATILSSSLQNLPNFASLFGFDYRLKALEDNFSELRQTNQYAEALSSIPGIVDQYLENKMKEAVDVAVQLKYERNLEESNTANQQFLDSIDEGMKKVIKEQVKKEVSKITPKIKKLVNDQLESEVLVRSSKEAKTSHAVAANLSELELKKILIDKMEANNSITVRHTQDSSTSISLNAYEADKILLDTYGLLVYKAQPKNGDGSSTRPPISQICDSHYRLRFPILKVVMSNYLHSNTSSKRPLSTYVVVVSQAASTYSLRRHGCRLRAYQMDRRLSAQLNVESNDSQIRQIRPLRNITLGCGNKSNGKTTSNLTGLLYEGLTTFFISFKEGDFQQTKRRVEDLQLGVKSYQKKLNLTKPDTYKSNLRRRDAYTPYSDPRGFIYENKDKKNRLMRIDELHKFSDGTLNDVQTALNDRLKGIRMEYLPQTFLSQRDKANARAMIKVIDKRLKTRRIMRSLERFVDHPSDTQVFTMKMEILLEPTSNKLMVDSILQLEILSRRFFLKLNLSDHRLFKDGDGDFRYSDTTHLSRSVKVLKLKNFKKDATLKLFKNESRAMSVQKSQVHKMAKFQDGEEIMLG